MGPGSYTRLKHCLIVDDDPGIRETLHDIASDLGLICYLAVDGEDAVAQVGKVVVDVILTDYRMPRMNGLELLAWCRQNGVHVPVVLMSAEADLLDVSQVALGDCCATVLKKPATTQGLVAALDAADKRVHHKNCVHVRLPGQNPDS